MNTRLPLIQFCFYSHAPAIEIPCKELLLECSEFITAPKVLYELELSKFNAPLEAVKARLEVKNCVDEISLENKLRLMKIMVISFSFIHSDSHQPPRQK